MPTQIKDLKHLNEILTEDPQDFFINLNGNIRSSKSISKSPEGLYNIINEIDWSEDTLTQEELFDENITFIGKALNLGQLYLY